MINRFRLAAALALLLGSGGAAPAQSMPDYMAPISGKTTSTPADVATKDVLALNTGMFELYGDAARIFQKNILYKHPVILGLFSGAGGRLILYRPGKPPTEAPQQLRSDIDMLAEQATEQEITSFLQQADIHAMNSDLSEQERARIERAQAGQVEAPAEPDAGPEKDEGRASASGEAPTDDLADLDEAELDSFILNEDEVKVKERVWMEFNKDYLEAALARQLKLEADQKAGIAPAPRSRKRQKPRDGTTAPTNSAAESAKQMMQQKRWSRRINYDVLNSLFPGESSKDFGAGAKSGSHDRTHALRPGTGDMDELSEDDDDDDDDESHRSKRTRTEDDWMALGGLTRQIADEDDDADYADDYENDAW